MPPTQDAKMNDESQVDSSTTKKVEKKDDEQKEPNDKFYGKFNSLFLPNISFFIFQSSRKTWSYLKKLQKTKTSKWQAA